MEIYAKSIEIKSAGLNTKLIIDNNVKYNIEKVSQQNTNSIMITNVIYNSNKTK